MRNILFTPKAFEDLAYFQFEDRKNLKRVTRLILETARHPFEGIGKPEPLRHNLGNAWSRRISDEHRLVYLVFDDRIEIVACPYHYRR